MFKQTTASEVRISDWSSDVCSSDLHAFQYLAAGGSETQHRIAIAGFIKQSLMQQRPDQGAPLVKRARLADAIGRQLLMAAIDHLLVFRTPQDVEDRKSTRLNSSH